MEGRKVIQDDVLLRLGDIFRKQFKNPVSNPQEDHRLKRVERRKAVLAALPTVYSTPVSNWVYSRRHIPTLHRESPERMRSECDGNPSHFRGMHTRNGGMTRRLGLKLYARRRPSARIK